MMSNSDKKKEKKHAAQGLWIIPYADFMTAMMMLFLSLYALASNTTNIRYEQSLLAIEESMGTETGNKSQFVDAAARIESSLSDRGLQNLANVEVNAQRIKIVMAAPILFTAGSADVNENAKPLLGELAEILHTLPNKITVEGHTCDIPVSHQSRYRSNLELSGARAFNVIRYMIERNQFNPDRFVALGYGESTPLRPNDCEENRAFNRRVEITVEK